MVACGIGTDTRAAVAAIKAGAKEYLPLPPDPELIGAILAAVTQESHAIVHADPRMAELLALAARVAASEASVLITGESGTGKELMARFVHARSKRAQARFVAVNCAAIPEALLESELFGHEKGAFTGAVARRIGRFEEANGGTLLLDEISEMDVRLQAKLLRAIQEREIDRVGGRAGQGRRPHHRHLQSRPEGRGGGRPLPRRPLLPPQRRLAAYPAAARAAARRRTARPALRRQVRPGQCAGCPRR